MDIVDEIKREIKRIELLNDMAEGMTEPRSTSTLTAALGEIERQRKLLQQVLTDAQARVLRKAAEARARAYSAEITRLEKEVQHYQALYVELQHENRELRGELMLKLGSTGG